MLVEFSVENYKSFKDRATLSMVAAKIRSDDPQLDEDALIPVSSSLDLLRCAGIYGANASGKSNFIKALHFMRYFIQNSTSDSIKGTGIGVVPFRLNTDTVGEPSLFEIIINVDSVQYRYGFEVTKDKVVSEWLFHAPKKRENRLFTRDESGIKSEGALLPDGHTLATRVRPNSLFLSVLAQFNNHIAWVILNWFESLNVVNEYRDNFNDYVLPYLKDPEKSARINQLVKQFDLSLDVVLAVDENLANHLTTGTDEPHRQEFVDFITSRALAWHIVFDGQGATSGAVIFDLDKDESEGTRKLIAIAALVDDALVDGTTCVIDEIDARLHPLITRAIVQLFNQKSTNPTGAQLVFVTHDTNLLDRAFLRRDQIWFAEKDRLAATHLVSLVEFKVRNDAAYEKHYLQGRYGGIPFLGDLTRLPGAVHAG